ncbi:MAG: diguanylate cyclase [Rhodocyclaceae bacterium]|nr:diguanylate cyclase [Rhodocyclaceae bacterium]
MSATMVTRFATHARTLRRVVMPFLALGLALWAGLSWSEEPLRFGVLAFRPKDQSFAQWKPLSDYLEKAIGRKVQLTVHSYRELDDGAAGGQLDIVMTNPAHLIVLKQRGDVVAPLVTLVNKEKSRNLTAFGGVMFVRANDSRISDLDSLRDKIFATVGKDSLGGFQAQAFEMVEAGLDQPDPQRVVVTGMPHDLVVEAVLKGRADVGFVRSGVLEALAAEHKLDLSTVRIIHRQNYPTFPFATSTRLYPEWPVAATKRVDEHIAKRISVALLSLPEDGDVARTAGFHGFAVPADYDGVQQLMRRLRVSPFDQTPEFTLADAWEKYKEWIWAVGILLVLLAIASVGLVTLYRHLKRSFHQLTLMASRQTLLLSSLGEGVYGVDQECRCVFVNPAALSMLDLKDADLIGKHQHDVFHASRPDGSYYPSEECPVHRTLRDGITREVEEEFLRGDETFPVRMTVTAMRDGDAVVGAVVAFQDITERKLAEQRIEELAYFDSLTGLPNRRMLLEHLRRVLQQAKRFHRSMALMFVDLDNFKQVNDSLGHDAGDEFLVEVAGRLKACLRAGDLVGRQGGDEFIVILPEISHPDDAAVVAEKLLALLREPRILVRGTEVSASASIGIAVFPADGDDDYQELMKKADLAMYSVKRAGRNGFRFYP